MEGRFKKSFSVIMVSKVKLNEYKKLDSNWKQFFHYSLITLNNYGLPFKNLENVL